MRAMGRVLGCTAMVEIGVGESWLGGLGIALWDVDAALGLQGLLRSHHHLLPCVALGATVGSQLQGQGLGHRAALWDACTPFLLHPCWSAQGVSHHPHFPGAHTALHVHLHWRRGAARLVSPLKWGMAQPGSGGHHPLGEWG